MTKRQISVCKILLQNLSCENIPCNECILNREDVIPYSCKNREFCDHNGEFGLDPGCIRYLQSQLFISEIMGLFDD